jgi:hypothetical protein
MGRIIVALIFLASCGYKGTTNNGISWVAPRNLGADIERLSLYTAHAFQLTTGRATDPDWMRGIRVEIRDDIGCTNCDGILLGNRIMLEPKGCLALTALAHELVHFLAFRVYGDLDPGHDDPALFGTGRNAVRLANMMAIEDGMCR